MTKKGEIDARYRKVVHMAAALSSMLQDLQLEIVSELDLSTKAKSAGTVGIDHSVLIEMRETVVDGVTGLAGLVRADNREPFSV